MTVTIVDYDAGNLRSVERACQAVGIQAVLDRDPDRLRKAERIVFLARIVAAVDGQR